MERSQRDSNINHAGVLIAQARAFRAREKALGWSGEFSAWLLNRAGEARLRAAGREVRTTRCGEVTTQFGPWWRTPKGIVIKYDQCGYNGFQCFSTPIGTAMHGQHLWHTFVIRWQRVPAFLGRCEYLGKEFPRQEVAEQVKRISGRVPAKHSGNDSEPCEPNQLDMFAGIAA